MDLRPSPNRWDGTFRLDLIRRRVIPCREEVRPRRSETSHRCRSGWAGSASSRGRRLAPSRPNTHATILWRLWSDDRFLRCRDRILGWSRGRNLADLLNPDAGIITTAPSQSHETEEITPDNAQHEDGRERLTGRHPDLGTGLRNILHVARNFGPVQQPNGCDPIGGVARLATSDMLGRLWLLLAFRHLDSLSLITDVQP